MANIVEHLKKILSARYGRDVRQSIHDSIDAINTQVTECERSAYNSAKTALESANNAKISEENSLASAEKANKSALDALDSAEIAELASQEAIEKAEAAAQSEKNASDSANVAVLASQGAAEKADKATQSEKNASDSANVAVLASQGAAEKANKAAISEANASDSADQAKKFVDEALELLESGAMVGPQGPKGDKGDTGESGVVTPIDGFLTLSVDVEGNLYAHTSDGESGPTFEYDKETGNLYYITED